MMDVCVNKDNNWARLLAYITGLVNQELLLQNEYLAAENRILRSHLAGTTPDLRRAKFNSATTNLIVELTCSMCACRET
jgi:hypothetical protein